MSSSGSGSLMKFQPRRQLELKPSEDSTRAGDLTSQVAHTRLLAGGFSSYHSNLSFGPFQCPLHMAASFFYSKESNRENEEESKMAFITQS